MSMLGTGAAASIAQTSLQSSQVASQRDKKKNDAARQADQQRDVDETYLYKVLEQRDTEETSARLKVGEQSNQSQKNHDEQDHDKSVAEAEAEPPSDPNIPIAPAAAQADQPLYRHLDIKA